MQKNQRSRNFFGILATCALLILSGCSPVSSSSPSPDSASSPPEATDQTPELDEFALALLAVEASYELFQSAGMTETVTSGGDPYILSYDPSNPEFVGALYNLNFDDVIAVTEKEMFTVYAAWLYANDGTSQVQLTPTGLSITNDVSSPFEVVIVDGLLVSGSAIDGSWSGSFVYQPDLGVLAKLDTSG
jgi:hypothetical protein